MAEADNQVKAALARQDTADKAIAAANAAAESADRTVTDRAADLDRAKQAIDAAVIAGGQAYAAVAAAVPKHADIALDAPAVFTAALSEATKAICEDDGQETPHSVEPGLKLLGPARAAAEALAGRAQTLTTAGAKLQGALQATETELAVRRATHDRETTALSKAVARRATAAKALIDKTDTLPEYGRALLPEDPMDVTPAAAEAALDTVNRHLQELERLEAGKEAARGQIDAHRKAHEAAAVDARARVEEPLRHLQRRLEVWAGQVRRVVVSAGLPESPALAGLEPDAAPPTTDTVEQYASTVARACAAVAADLAEQSEAAATDEARHRARLAAAARALGDDVEGIDADDDLAAPGALHPLIAAEHAAHVDAKRHKLNRETALGQIRPAADLDFAIAAGQVRHNALEEVRKQLANAKFLAYLTSKRTEALLRIASDMLGQLSDGGFGFAHDFKIVSRGSGVIHGSERLSGGEKFLASLALALALVELHSRGGPRLGALFLDEGFAALDAVTLDMALSVLRDHAGGDRLVMTVSHLHAVAEAVDDVLWVEKGTSGSSARWMTDTERDALAQRDPGPGLI